MRNTIHTWTVWTSVVFLLFSCSKEVAPIRLPTGSAETRTKVAVVDTGLDEKKVDAAILCAEGQQDLTEEGKFDREGHGTNISGIILKDLDPRFECLLPIKVYRIDQMRQTTARLTKGLELARSLGAAFVNISMGGAFPIWHEEQAIRVLVESGTEVIVTAGNDGRNLAKDCSYYPACYKLGDNLWVVGASDLSVSNYSGPVRAYMRGSNVCALGVCLSGTSQATAAWTGFRLKFTRPKRLNR